MRSWRGMPTILSVKFEREFFGGPEALEKQGRKSREKTSFEEIRWEICGHFSKNSPDLI